MLDRTTGQSDFEIRNLVKKMNALLNKLAEATNRDFEGAIDKYNQAIQRDSSFAEAYRQASAAYYILSKSTQALPYYAELAKRVPDAPRYIGAHLRIAEASFSNGNYQDALQHINKYLSFITSRDRYYQQSISIRNNCQFALSRIKNTNFV